MCTLYPALCVPALLAVHRSAVLSTCGKASWNALGVCPQRGLNTCLGSFLSFEACSVQWSAQIQRVPLYEFRKVHTYVQSKSLLIYRTWPSFQKGPLCLFWENFHLSLWKRQCSDVFPHGSPLPVLTLHVLESEFVLLYKASEHNFTHPWCCLY